MRKLLFGFFLLISLFSQNLFASTHRGGAELLNEKAYDVNFGTSVFQTSGYYDKEGVESELPEGSEYRLIDADFKVSYGISRKLEITGLARLRSVSSTLGDETLSKSGPESVGIEAKYAFDTVDNLRYAIGVHYRQTLYTNANIDPSVGFPADELILGDSGSEYGVALYMTYANRPWKWDFKLGYISPPNELSDEFNYKLQSMYNFGQLGFFAGVEGIYSLKKDEFTEDPASKPYQATGATQLFNSINREKIAPYLGINYAFNGKFFAELKGQTIISGTSTDKGSLGVLSISWSSDGVTSESIKVNSFKEYIIDGSVLKVSARSNFIKIDQGLSTDVEKGMKFDIYQTDYFGGNVLVATGVAYDVGADWSIIKLVKRYKEIEIKPGFAARGY